MSDLSKATADKIALDAELIGIRTKIESKEYALMPTDERTQLQQQICNLESKGRKLAEQIAQLASQT